MTSNTSHKISRILSAIDQAMDERQGGVVQALRDLERVCDLPHGYIHATLRRAMEDEKEYFGDVNWCDEDIANALECCNVSDPVPNAVELVRTQLERHWFTDCMIEAGWHYIYDVIDGMRGSLEATSDT